MEPTYAADFDGQEFQFADADTVGASSGLADDRVLAELLHLPPFLSSGSVTSKRIIPYTQGAFPAGSFPAGQYTGVVQPTGSANGAVNIFPFRAIVGSRNAPTATPADNASFPNPANSTGALANWRDVRSGIFIGSPTQLAFTQVLASSPAAPRWDLVYATIQVDSSTVSVTPRRVKNPSGGSISNVSVPDYLLSPVSVGVVTGSTSGALPTLPADTTGQYNFALAYVRIPGTFSGTYTFLSEDIRACTTLAGPANDFVYPSSGMRSSPCNGNNDANNGGAGSANAFNTTGSQLYSQTTSGQRPGAFLPPDMVGGVSKFAFIDTVSTQPSHVNGSIVDSSIDWRHRIFRYDVVEATSSLVFCTDSSITGSEGLPFGNGGESFRGLGNSVQVDGTTVAGKSTVFTAGPTQLPSMAAASAIGLLVDPTTGNLIWYQNGTPSGCRFVLWIDATAKMSNV